MESSVPKDLFGQPINTQPSGFVYVSNFLSSAEEAELLKNIETLEFGRVVMHGVESKREVTHFGYGYSFETRKLIDPIPIPYFLLPLQEKVAEFLKIRPADLAEVLITKYPVGSVIGWHRDAPPFDGVIGISLYGSCVLKLRPHQSKDRKVISVTLEPRSLYVLDQDARANWEHHIPPVKTLRYSITFRTLRK